jgi:hypothetical protein
MDLIRIALNVASKRYSASSPRVVSWDEIGMEWSDHGTVPITGQFGGDLATNQRAVLEVNKVLDEQLSGHVLEEGEEPGWTMKSIKRVDDLSKVTPGDFDKYYADNQKREVEEAKEAGEAEPIFTQNFLSGPGWVGVTRSDRNHLSLLLVQ